MHVLYFPPVQLFELLNKCIDAVVTFLHCKEHLGGKT